MCATSAAMIRSTIVGGAERTADLSGGVLALVPSRRWRRRVWSPNSSQP